MTQKKKEMASQVSEDWKNQVAIVTGAASGIGLAVTKQMRKLGARVASIDTNEGKLEEAFGGDSGECLVIPVDIGDESAVDAAVGHVVEKYGRIDMLFNSAGITGATGIGFGEIAVEDFDRVCRVNIRGAFLLCKAVVPHMLDAGYGRICLVASIAGKEGNAGMAAYSTSKAAVIGLVKSLGKELASTGVTVNAMAPAVIDTPLLEGVPQEQINYMAERIPMKRFGKLEEVVSLATYIMSPECSFTTGFCFDLSGGRAVY